jgi:ribonucleotide reductase beta subunit family protein with ferritin-like domain
MKPLDKINILGEKTVFANHNYPWALDYIDSLEASHWKFDETSPGNDIGSIHKLTPAELHGIKTVLKLFTQYELSVGNDYWLTHINSLFPQPEIQMMATAFANNEVTHARFYSELNRIQGLDTVEFMSSWQDDKDLADRMKFIGKQTILPNNYNALDILRSLAAFVLIEGVVLFSSFAFLKHFGANGKNLLKGLVSGNAYSIADELIHTAAGTKLFITLLEEAKLTDKEFSRLSDSVNEIARQVIEHENIIIRKIFSEGRVVGITRLQLTRFVATRTSIVLSGIGIDSDIKAEYSNIDDWFMSNIKTLTQTDFFSQQSTAYSRSWDRSKF